MGVDFFAPFSCDLRFSYPSYTVQPDNELKNSPTLFQYFSLKSSSLSRSQGSVGTAIARHDFNSASLLLVSKVRRIVQYTETFKITTHIIIIIILGISFMQDIYTYIPETNHVPREHCVATNLM
jgi:hypothetical protein